MDIIKVSTLAELKKAEKDQANEIIVEGELAQKLYKVRKLKKITKGIGLLGLTVLAVALGAATISAPVTGGLSYYAVTSAVTLTGAEISMIILASSLGIALIMAIHKDYDEIDYSEGHLHLKRKAK